MKVLQINSVCGVGSTGRIATDLGRVIEAKGHESYIAYGRGTARAAKHTIKIGSKLDNYIHVAKTRALDRHGFGSKAVTEKFIKKIVELNPDIIHLHNIHGYYLNIEILFKYLKIANKPVIWTLHDCWAFTGHCSHFDFIDCQKWKNGCYNCPQKSSYPASIFLDNSKMNYLDKMELFNGIKNMIIVTPSEWLAKLVRSSFLGKYRVDVINNGIDLEVFRPTESNFRQKYNIEKEFIILGIASVWGQRKGLDYFFNLSKKLENNEVIVLVGVTEEQKTRLPKNIIGITKTNNTQELAEIYTASDVFINPTLEDTFPTTNLEALGCGIPVITFNTGGSPESIEESCGFVIDKGNLNELYNKIQIIRNSGKSFYKDHCLDRARKLYNSQDRYNDYGKLYKEILH